MDQLPAIRLSGRVLPAIVLVQALALFVRAYLRLHLQRLGFEPSQANDLAYLVVPPVLLLMLLPVFRNYGHFLMGLLRRSQLKLRILLTAILIGLLMRIIWWCQLVATISFGFAQGSETNAAAGPMFAFSCPTWPVIGIGFLVMAILVPVTEEILHRGLIQSAFAHKGRSIAVLLSTLIFTAFHTPSGFVFVMGGVLGWQFWNSRTLWTTIVTHSTYNGLVQLDWRCLHGSWNPGAEQLPALLPGLWAGAILITSSITVLWLLSAQKAGAPRAPRP